MNIVSVSTDRNVFKQNSAVRARLIEYGSLVDELHVIVFAKRGLGLHDEVLASNVFLYPVNSYSRFDYIFFAILRAVQLRSRGVRINVVTTQDPFETGLAGYIIARILAARLHVQVHTDFMSPYFARESFLNSVRVLIAKRILCHADAIRVVSVRIKNSLLAIGCKLQNITVLPIFVEVKSGHGLTDIDLKKKYPKFEKHILMASRLSEEKNIALAIRAMRDILAKYPKTGLIILGEGKEKKSLSQQIEKYHISENVVFEGWRDDVSSYYKTADLFLLTSNYEGYGMTAVEALIAGCPVVMTDVGVAGEVVHDGENGLIFPVGDKHALVDALERIFSENVKLVALPPKLPPKDDYLNSYKNSWRDAILKE